MRITSKITSNELFNGCNIEQIKKILKEKQCKKIDYKSGEIIFSQNVNTNSIGIIEKGKVSVLSASKTENTLIKYLGEGELFGVATLFSNSKNYVSNVVAKTNCTIFFITADCMAKLFDFDKKILFNYVNFLSQKIQDLNSKISCFTESSAESKILNYLESVSDDTKNVTINQSLASLSKMLDIGRASLYRALDNLENENKIKRIGKKILLL